LATGGAGIVPAVVASFTHRRSDSVVVPIFAATCTRLIPEATSTSACFLCASSNLRPCGAASERAGAAALLVTFLVPFFLFFRFFDRFDVRLGRYLALLDDRILIIVGAHCHPTRGESILPLLWRSSLEGGAPSFHVSGPPAD